MGFGPAFEHIADAAPTASAGPSDDHLADAAPTSSFGPGFDHEPEGIPFTTGPVFEHEATEVPLPYSIPVTAPEEPVQRLRPRYQTYLSPAVYPESGG